MTPALSPALTLSLMAQRREMMKTTRYSNFLIINLINFNFISFVDTNYSIILCWVSVIYDCTEKKSSEIVRSESKWVFIRKRKNYNEFFIIIIIFLLLWHHKRKKLIKALKLHILNIHIAARLCLGMCVYVFVCVSICLSMVHSQQCHHRQSDYP